MSGRIRQHCLEPDPEPHGCRYCRGVITYGEYARYRYGMCVACCERLVRREIAIGKRRPIRVWQRVTMTDGELQLVRVRYEPETTQ